MLFFCGVLDSSDYGGYNFKNGLSGMQGERAV